MGGVLTLDGQGNNNAVWVFKIGSTLTTISGASVVPGVAKSFEILAGSAVTNSGASFINNGDLGTSPATASFGHWLSSGIVR